MKLEICALNIESAIIAQQNGANRIELCDNIADGGTTPSAGTILEARKRLIIDLFIMIRPRGGDFLYTPTEFEVMKKDVIFAKDNGADGVVVGILNCDGSVDLARTQEIVELAKPMQVTFHRAFDCSNNYFKALEDIIQAGAHRILTSGGETTAYEGINLISQLVKKAENRIKIMAGCGISENNFIEIIDKTGVEEIHLSAKKNIPSLMKFKNTAVEINTDDLLIVDDKIVNTIANNFH